MQSLNRQQIELITSDVEDARITLLHLADELIDHICCEVENLMAKGKSFDEAYEIIKQQTGIKVLQKIQENTNYLIDINYRRMKMTMKITGNISLALLGMATVMKLLHWPFSALLMYLGFMLLCLVFFPSAIYTNYKEVKIKASKILHISVLVGGILFMFGVLFKVLHLLGAAQLLFAGWVILLFIFLPILLTVKLKESTTLRDKSIILVGIIGLIVFELSTMFKLFHLKGAAQLMIIGSILLVTIFLPMFSYSKFKEAGRITGQYIFLLITTMFFILLSILLALNVSTNFLNVFVNEESNSAKIVSYLEAKNQKLYDDFKGKSDSTQKKLKPQVILIQNGTKKLCEQIDSIKIELIKVSDGVDESTAKNLIHNTDGINNKAGIQPVNNTMIGMNNDGLAYQLKQDLIKYREAALSVITSNNSLNKNISKLLDTSNIYIDSEHQTWEQLNFNNNTIIGSIAILTDIEKRVRMVESQTIQYINTEK